MGLALPAHHSSGDVHHPGFLNYSPDPLLQFLPAQHLSLCTFSRALACHCLAPTAVRIHNNPAHHMTLTHHAPQSKSIWYHTSTNYCSPTAYPPL